MGMLMWRASLGGTNSPAKQSPECKGRRKLLAIMEAVDHTKCVRDGHPQTLAEPVQILLFCPRPVAQCQEVHLCTHLVLF